MGSFPRHLPKREVARYRGFMTGWSSTARSISRRIRVSHRRHRGVRLCGTLYALLVPCCALALSVGEDYAPAMRIRSTIGGTVAVDLVTAARLRPIGARKRDCAGRGWVWCRSVLDPTDPSRDRRRRCTKEAFCPPNHMGTAHTCGAISCILSILIIPYGGIVPSGDCLWLTPSVRKPNY